MRERDRDEERESEDERERRLFLRSPAVRRNRRACGGGTRRDEAPVVDVACSPMGLFRRPVPQRWCFIFFPTKLYVSAQFRVIHSQNDRVGCRLRSFGLDGQSQSTGQRLRVRLNRFRLTRSS
ncbi:hypothetical protein Hdeb2414_s0075g00775901 [Helianthus debilis subsp. tardiflorus]